MQTTSSNALVLVLIVIICVVLWHERSPAQAPPPKPQPPTEKYMVVKLPADDNGAAKLMNDRFREGWEVCSTYTQGSNAHCVFCRKVASK